MAGELVEKCDFSAEMSWLHQDRLDMGGDLYLSLSPLTAVCLIS